MPRWVLLHGTPLSPEVFSDVAERLQDDGQVLCPRVELGRAATTTRELAAAIVADLPPGGPLHLVGHSFGGQVAVDLVLAAPELVASLCLICSRDSPFPPFAAAAQQLRWGRRPDLSATLSRWFRPAESAANGPVVRYARACLEQADPQSWALALDAIAGFDRTREVSSISAPCTLIAAEHDTVSTPAAMSALAARLRHARLEVVPGAFHMSPFVQPDALAEMIKRAAAEPPQGADALCGQRS